MKSLLLLLAGAAFLLGICSSAAPNNTCRPEFTNYPPVQHLDRRALRDVIYFVQEIFALEEGHTSEPRWECYAFYIDAIWDDPVIGKKHHMWELFTNVKDGYHYTNLSTTDVIDDSEAVWNTGWFAEVTGTKYDTIVITHMDHLNYGVMHFCPNDANPRNKYERFVTFTHSPTPNETLLEELRSLVADVGFPTEFGVRIAHHDNCDYDYNYMDDKEEGEEESADKDDFDG